MAKPLTRNARKNAGRRLAIDAARLCEAGNCEEILVLDLRGVSPVTDYFVIATGTSDRQMRSVADDIIAHGRDIGQKVYHVAGIQRGDWIVLDFVDVVVHLFDLEHRRYYDLELIWGGSPRVRWRKRRTAKENIQ
ncbi:MAG: ribosome silencing factor [Phycisphaerae bacterium]